MRKLLPSSKPSRYGLIALIGVVSTVMGVVAIGQQQTNFVANYVLEMNTVVVGPPASLNLGSNVSVATGDVVKWVVYTGHPQLAPQPDDADHPERFGVPEVIKGTVAINPGFSAPNNTVGPPGTLFTVSGNNLNWEYTPQKIQYVPILGDTGQVFEMAYKIDLQQFFKCDPGRDTIIAWDKLRIDQTLPWGTGISKIEVGVLRKNGFQGGYIPVLDSQGNNLTITVDSNTSSGVPKWIDISSVPITERNLMFAIAFTKGTDQNLSLTALNGAPIDVTWRGDQAQVCLEATSGVLTSYATKVNVDFFKASDPNASIAQLETGQRFDDTPATQTGFGPNILVASLGGTTDVPLETVLIQSSFNMKEHTGDLTMFKWLDLTNPFSTAEKSFTYDRNSKLIPDRPMFTSRVFASQFQDSLDRLGFTWDLLINGNQSFLDFGPTKEAKALNRTFTYINPAGIYQATNSLINPEGSIAQRRTEYLRGSNVLEPPNADAIFRKRNSFLGPIVNSSPVWLPQNPQVGYPENLFKGYEVFRASTVQDRLAAYVLYGGHDGMLHGFKVNSAGLSEAFAYMPNFMLENAYRYSDGTLPQLGLTPFAVDSTPMVRDVAISPNDTVVGPRWRTAVVSSLGRQGRGIFAIDITSRFGADAKSGSGFPLRATLWEYTPTISNLPTQTIGGAPIDAGELRDLGQMVYSPPIDDTVGAEQIVRMKNDRWAAVVGNGINSHIGPDPARNGTGRAVLYLFYFGIYGWNATTSGYTNPTDSFWLRIPVSEDDTVLAFNNGLLSPRPYDMNGDGRVDFIYAGDMLGNLWRFDVGDLNAVKVTRLFKANNGKPIVAAPVVRPFKNSTSCKADGACQIVVFGTGYPASPLTPGPYSMGADHAIFGIVDVNDTSNKGGFAPGIMKNSQGSVILEKDLAKYTLQLPTGADDNLVTQRAVIPDPTNTAAQIGWKLSLWNGEQMIANPQVSSNNSVLFTTGRYWRFRTGGKLKEKRSWLTQLDLFTGAPSLVLKQGVNFYASVGYGGAMYEAPPVVKSSTDPSLEYLIVQQPGGVVNQPRQTPPSALGRLSWREIFGDQQ